MRALAFAAVLAPSLAFAGLSGPATVVDGDTLGLNGEEISLYGIDALEITQSCSVNDEDWFCGWDAADRLEEIIAGRDVSCEPMGTGAEGDALYRCMAGEDDLAGLMLDEGLAVTAADTDDDYVVRETAASEAGTGIWAGTFIEPQVYRDSGGCNCSARKKAMQETAAYMKEQRGETEVEETDASN